jgi:hypothetical protein
VILLGWLLSAIALPQGEFIPLDRPLQVSADTRVEPGRYVRPPLDPRGEHGAIVLRGARDLTLDLTDVELFGAEPGSDLDGATGFGVLLEDCTDVTIRGGTIGGYRGCIVARRSRGLTIEDVSFRGWYGQRLRSTTAAEHPGDWLWPHDNDRDEWITKYGGAISLTDCEGAVIRRCRGRKGQNGILFTRTNSSEVYDNDFSFLSGWGLGMYRASNNVVSRNVFDYCVRGYSHDVYWRGQDSAAILMFERCSDNVIALNSGTHSGDGLFLFAGQDSVEGMAFERGETEVGGSDRNTFWKNDFSYAVANAIEATFSRDNVAYGNLGRGCHQHGVWGGYSSRMLIVGNDFSDTIGGGVTIEHGQECVVSGNVLRNCTSGVELYWDEDPQFVNGVYGQHFDTDSRDHWVSANTFAGNEVDLVVERSSGVVAVNNRPPFLQLSIRGERDQISTSPSFDEGLRLLEELGAREFELPGEQVAFDPDVDDGEGLETIVMGEWGPWDFRSGEPQPEPRLPGGLLAGVPWDARWFSWRGGPDPREQLDDWRGLAEAPAVAGVIEVFADPFGGRADVREAVSAAHFGLIAETTLEVEAGRYRLEVLSDDGVRVLVDGEPVLENWTWHAPTRDTAELELAAGERVFTIEYFQIDGALALLVELASLADDG